MRTVASKLLNRQLDRLDVEPVGREHRVTDASAGLARVVLQFVHGARLAASDRMDTIHEDLAKVPLEHRGFAYEGSAMSAHLLDRLTPGRGWRVPLLLGGVGCRYRYLTHVGVGFGMARLRQRTPQSHWGLDPLLRWLAVDGSGFNQLFFATSAARSEMLSTPVANDTGHIAMQGRGRALWFVAGADLEWIADTVASLPRSNRDALWRGVALAAAYAGANRPVIGPLLEVAPRAHQGAVRQGLRFAGAALSEGRETDPHGLTAAVGTGADCEVLASSVASSVSDRQASARSYRRWQAELEGQPVQREAVA